jgi:uncharacterized repeat protein (TIGR01451 family)
VRRWGVGLVATLALVGFGLLYANRTLLVAAVIPLTYVFYGAVSQAPERLDLAVTRRFDQPDPRPGDPVTVTLTVENAGESVLTDLRLIDGVPAELAVTDGAPRACVALAPGETATVTYTVVAKRGQFAFEHPVARARSLAATETRTETVEAGGDVTLACANAVRDAPVRDASLPRAGTLPTDTGGSGLEFYATRQYQSGDPMNRVDWRHYAKTGEFVTVQYRQEQSIRTVVVVDARPVGRVTPRPGYPTGAELCAYAGERLYDALDGAGTATTVTAVGVDPGTLDGLVGPDGLLWVDPETTGHVGRARQVFERLQTVADSDARSETLAEMMGRRESADGRTDGLSQTEPEQTKTAMATDGGPDETVRRLLARLPPNAQVVLCSPLLDDWPVAFARALSVRGYPQLTLSPDVTGSDSLGGRILGADRRRRLRALGKTGATTVSWDVDQPIDHALRRSLPHLLGGR